MTQQQAGVFSLNAETSRDGWAHGKAFASGSYGAVASLHPGITLPAQAAPEVGLSGAAPLADAAKASFSAGADVTAALRLAAALPLRLFTSVPLSQAGNVAS